MTEAWKAIPGWEGMYEVSDQGRVRSLARYVSSGRGHRPVPERIRKLSSDRKGYPTVQLARDSKLRRYYVHRLVLEAFVGPAPKGLVACHANDVKTDNRLENLRWDTYSQNMQDCLANGKHGRATQTHCKWGHPFDEANTGYFASRRTHRVCLACRARHAADRRARERAAA